jgi:hypothetical protein
VAQVDAQSGWRRLTLGASFNSSVDCTIPAGTNYMTLEQELRMMELCTLIQFEEDPIEFSELVEELNKLLDVRRAYLAARAKKAL